MPSMTRLAISTAERVLQWFLERIMETLQVEEIWLFGSRAKGTGTSRSDWNFFDIVSDDSPEADLDLGAIWSRLTDLREDRVKVFPVRRGEFEEVRVAFGVPAQIASEEGVRVWTSLAHCLRRQSVA